jgi:primosomal protein N' (replication factor Y)
MQFAEIVVNVPIRPTFTKRLQSPPPQEEAAEEHAADQGDQNDRIQLQLYHYHLPVELEDKVSPGHIVWAPFGRQQVQGIVLRLVESSPVPTRPISRLARPEPVLNSTQLALAAWIADTYVAPLAEAVKLFVPPGLLSKDETKPGVRVRRELQIELRVDSATAQQRIRQFVQPTKANAKQARILELLCDQPLLALSFAELRQRCPLSSPAPIHNLQAQGVLAIADQQVCLAVSVAEAEQMRERLLGVEEYERVVAALTAAGRPLWKSELYAQVETTLDKLRNLQEMAIVELSEQVRFRNPLAGLTYSRTSPPILTGEQAQVWAQVQQALAQTLDPTLSGVSQAVKAPKFLLHGVTGSGKTEIYLHAIERVLAAGRQAIVLVPEIALTPQTVTRFAGRFPGRVTVIHSELSSGERYDVWRALRAGEFDVVIGPRSALFAPLARLGLIVIDEEHESSYKQDSEEWGSFTVFYDARTAAKCLADLTQSLLILGSATPSLEAYYAVTQGELRVIQLLRRVAGRGPLRPNGELANQTTANGAAALATDQHPVYADLPPVEVVDMRQELRAGNRSVLSRSLLAELQTTLNAGEQAILFLNRRGAYTFILCRDCGYVAHCQRCDAPLVYHEQGGRLVCHHCDRQYPTPTVCPQCQSKRIRFFGSGTQRIEEVVLQLTPQARVLRWDADTTSRKGSHAEILQRFAAHKADVLIGTQMIAKGLDLPMVTLVGVVAADTGLNLPDFRSAERTFQLLAQVSGRAGRGERSGRVIVQTYNPQHYAIQAAAKHDYAAFVQRELAFRREHGYPPVQRMARLIYWEKNEAKSRQAALHMASALQQTLLQMGVEGKKASVLGPAPAFFAKYRGYYRWQVLLRAPNPAEILHRLTIPFGWRIDIDPASVL